MKKISSYDVYGIGNALIDIEFNVTEKTLCKLNIEKGVRTLVDTTQQKKLLSSLRNFSNKKTCGGSAANTIATTALLGGKCFYNCRVANDELGKFFLNKMKELSIETNADLENSQTANTGSCIVLITPDAERSMNTCLNIAEKISKNDLDLSVLKKSNYLYIEGYLIVSSMMRSVTTAAFEYAKRHHIKTSLSLSDLNVVRHYKKELQTLMKNKIDLLFCNKEESFCFCETKNLEETKIQLQQYAKTFAITLGEKGSILFDGKHFTHAKAYNVTAINTVGAGDTFAGAFLYALTHDYDFVAAGNFANIAAAYVVRKTGAHLDESEAYEILKKGAENLPLF